MKGIFFLFAILCFTSLSYSDTIVVPDDQPHIQAAIIAAKNVDTVLVKPGTYVENISFLAKKIEVIGEEGAAATVIDGSQSGTVVTFVAGESPDAVLQGFTITNGASDKGGGILCANSEPILMDNVITLNAATKGGGMYNEQSSPTLINCIFYQNEALSNGGGGMFNDQSHPTVNACFFFENAGGGMLNRLKSNPLVEDCTFINNSLWGMMNDFLCEPIVIGCQFNLNDGSGMQNQSSDTMVVNCSFIGNSAPSGGGMVNAMCSPVVVNCTFIDNSAVTYEGGGMYSYDSSAAVINCTFYSNSAKYSGGALFNNDSSGLTVTNCILWNDTPDEIDNYSGSGHYPEVTYSCIKDGYFGTGNIDDPPLFVDEAEGDFHLTYSSPCRDSGINSAVIELQDFEGDPRIAYGTVDMGADEFHTHLYWTGHATPGGDVEFKFVGLPGTSPVQLWMGSGILDPPMHTKYGHWFLHFPLLAHVVLGAIPSPDGVLVLPFTFRPDTAAPLSLPLQAGVGMELTNLSVMDVE
jgi:hypothetical protein